MPACIGCEISEVHNHRHGHGDVNDWHDLDNPTSDKAASFRGLAAHDEHRANHQRVKNQISRD
jgi:hypothetical protein